MRIRHALVAVVVAAATGLTGCSLQPNDYTLPGQVAVGSDGYSTWVTFDQIANLVPNSAVELNDVVVGTVASIEVSNWQAKVKLRLLRSANIPSNAIFSIGQKTLLGAQYVEVALPAKPSLTPLEARTSVPESQTGTYPATEQVLGAVALLLNNGGLSQIQTITSQLSAAFTDHVPDTRELIRRSTQLLSAFDQNKGQVVGALQALNRLSVGLSRDNSALGSAIDRLGPGLKSLADERQSLVNALNATGRTGAQASRVIDASRAGLLQTVNGLRPILANLQGVAATLPDALKIAITIPFPAMTTTEAVRGDYANLFATIDVRASSFATTWLGAMLGGTSTTARHAPVSAASGSRRSSGTAPPSGSPDPTTTSSGACLLSLLGLC